MAREDSDGGDDSWDPESDGIVRRASSVFEEKSQVKRTMHASFGSRSALQLMKYQTHIRKAGWEHTDPITDGVDDGSWKFMWKAALCSSQAVLVLNNKEYRAKVANGPESPLAVEAYYILQHLGKHPDFRVYVLDPEKPEQGPASIRALLLDGVSEINLGGWKKFLEDPEAGVRRDSGKPDSAKQPNGGH